MEPLETLPTSPRLGADEDVSQSPGETAINQQGAQSRRRVNQDQRQLTLQTDGSELQRLWGNHFQDSNLSPALPLLHTHSEVDHTFTEYSLFQQSDHEFAPLRPYPDISMASERFHLPAQDHTAQSSQRGSLSQYPLAQTTLLSEEGANSCCSLSQHSLSPGDQGRAKEAVTTDRQEIPSREDVPSREKDSETVTDLTNKLGADVTDDETYFLNKDVPAQQLLDLLQRDIGMANSSSSAVSSTSETSVKVAAKSKPGSDLSLFRREGPPGEASLPVQQTQPPERDLHPDQSRTSSADVSNITTGRRGTQPDDSTEELHRELLSEVKRHSSREGGSEDYQQKGPGHPLTPHPSGAFSVKPSATRTNVGGGAWTGPFSTGIERGHRDLWSSGTQTGMDGSYLSFLPQSQSTPGVFKAPPKSAVKTKLAQLSAIESSCQSSTDISSPQSAPPAAGVPQSQEEEATSEKVKSLPSLNYMQKVDAWRANQSSGKTSLFDSLALQGFSGLPPKKRAYDAVSDSLNRILSQQARSQHQPPAAQSSSTAPPGSSSRRGEAVGSAPGDGEDAASASGPSAGLQTRSSLSTVLSVKRDEQTERRAAEDQSQTEDRVQHPVLSLGQFIDVSPERDVTLSSSQDSYIGDMKLGTSVGASSVSLEVDNYAPYWTSKPPTPPPLHRPRDFNIEERIPLYLHNLGIDQSPSTILTPFVPRGPIREPEFSPTDLCTIKGSIGSPTKSTQPSEVSGGSPLKGEFSRSSILSVDSSMSIPFSMDSLGPAASVPEETTRLLPPSDSESSLNKGHSRLASSPLPEEDSYPSTLLTTLHQQRDSSVTSSQNTIQLADRFGSELSLATDSKGEEGDLGSPLRTSRSVEQSGEVSFVSSKALFEIRKLLSQAESVVSAGSSSSSSPSSAGRRHLSDDNVGDPRTRPFLMWARSASDSMLTSEKVREGSVGRESVASSGQRRLPSTPPLLGAAAARSRPEDDTRRRAAESFVLSKSSLRAEPEGCSAAPPDNTAPPPQPTSAPDTSTPPSTDTAGITEEDKETATQNLVRSSSTSPEPEDADQGAVSDGSSESSLAVRVAKLLQSESPATMVSSSASATDQEESKAREWIKLKISGQQCEPLELDKEDRMRIEEIKNELLLKNPLKSQASTDTESSVASSLRVLKEQDPVQQVETFPAHVGVEPDHNLQGPSSDIPDSGAPLQNPLPRPDLEAQVREIATKEGVTLPRSNLRPLTSITIATRRRSSSPSPSTSPSPHLTPPRLLHLSELSTEAGEQLKADEKTATEAASSHHVTPPPPLRAPPLWAPPQAPDHRRQEAVGGQSEESSAAPQTSVSGVGREADQTTASSPRASPARTGHVSHIHVTLSPKTTSPVPPSHTDAVQEQRQFVPLRHLSSAASSPDEGVGLSSPPEWCDQRGPEGADASTHRKTTTTTLQGRVASNHRALVSPGPLNTESPALPVLLPYKPRGSEELFYMPQTEADVSSAGSSMESTHTDSDDAVPPRFSSEVLGHQDPGLDRGVTIRHTEGIYSKRLKTSRFKMNEPTHRADETSQTNVTRPPKMPVAFTRAPLSSPQEVSKRDQGTSPVQFLGPDEPSCARSSQPLRVEQDYDKIRHRWHRSSVPETGLERDPVPPQLSRSSLDQLWQRFCTRWSPEESRPTSDREASLLERLERLSRLIHGSKAVDVMEDYADPEETPPRSEDAAAAKQSRRRDAGLPAPCQAWTQTPQRKDEDSVSSSFSQDSFQSERLFPADRDESETSSTASGSVSGSVSTVDTARLIRAFGAHRVQRLKTSSSLSKLYDAIDRQKDGREQRRGRNQERSEVCSLLETSTTDGSVAADSSSSTSTYTLPTHLGPSRTLAAKKAVKLVNKGVQAGDLELVWNGTRRHTRDVGTTFPSPREARTSRRVSSSSSSLEKGGRGLRSPSKPQGVQKHRKSKKSPPKSYPEGVSWFISADELRSEARKENRPEEEESTWRPSSAWFEPYSRVKPWREPLRARQVPEEGNEAPGLTTRTEPESGSRTKTRPSLQEALASRRPEFISQSMLRVKRLALQVEERKLQDVFSRERQELFHGPGRAGRLQRPEGTAQLRRAVPRKEMIQRSKQIYENLPEVQRRKEEERRRAEYRSYRLNARLYNKRVTSRVLGRRTMVQ